MEMERDGCITRLIGNPLILTYNSNSHHQPSSEQSVLSTLLHRAHALCDKDDESGAQGYGGMAATTSRSHGFNVSDQKAHVLVADVPSLRARNSEGRIAGFFLPTDLPT
jgi:hypothetical protein